MRFITMGLEHFGANTGGQAASGTRRRVLSCGALTPTVRSGVGTPYLSSLAKADSNGVMS